MVVYVLHFDRPYQHAKHYLGSCQDLERRLTQHGKGRGARLLEVVHAVGIGWQLARTWCGGKHRERQRKNQGGASRLCPICKEARRATHHEISQYPLLGTLGRPPAALRHGLQTRSPHCHAAPATPAARTLTYEDARGTGQYPPCPHTPTGHTVAARAVRVTAHPSSSRMAIPHRTSQWV